MKRFKFRLETVEKVRRLREQQVLRLLGAANRELENARSRKRRQQEALARGKIEREGLGMIPTSQGDFAVADDYIRGTEQRIVQADQGIFRAEKSVQKAKRVYLIALRQLRAIELLREKHLLEWKRETSKREQKLIDDLVSSRLRLQREEEVETR